MPVIGTWFLICNNPSFLTDDSVMKLDWQPLSRSAQQVWNFPLQSLTLIWAVAHSTQFTGDSLNAWYVACSFSCCYDKSWLPLLYFPERSLFLWINVWWHFPQILHPRDWQSFIMRLLLKQLMQFVVLHYLVSFVIWQLLKCVALWYSMWTLTDFKR